MSVLDSISSCRTLESQLAALKRQKCLQKLKAEFQSDTGPSVLSQVSSDWTRVLSSSGTQSQVESALRASFQSKENSLSLRREEAEKLKEVAETLSTLHSNRSDTSSHLSRNSARSWSNWVESDLSGLDSALLKKEAELASNQEKAKHFGN